MAQRVQEHPLQQAFEALLDNGLDGAGEALRILVNEASKIERSQYLNAAPYERSSERVDHANGYKPKTVMTRLGNVTFDVPQVRSGGFYPSALEKGSRSEQALNLALAQMYVQGVSTRKVCDILVKLVGPEVAISSTQVSRIAARLDEGLAAWRERPLDETPYVLLDARYERVREAGRIVDCAVLVAVALGSLVLSFASADPEKEAVGPWAVWLLPLGALAVVAALLWHRVAPYPLVPRGLFSRRVLFGVLTSVAVGAALVAVVVDVPVLARLTLTDSQTAAAMVLVRFLLALPIGAVLGGVSLRRLGPGLVACAGLVLATGALGVMSTWGTSSLADSAAVTMTLVAAGFGLGLAIAPVNAAVLDDVDAEAHGVAGSVVVVARMIGMVVGLALLTAYGLRRFYAYVETLPAEVALREPAILLDAGIVQVQTVFFGAALCAAAGAAAALGLGLRRTEKA